MFREFWKNFKFLKFSIGVSRSQGLQTYLKGLPVFRRIYPEARVWCTQLLCLLALAIALEVNVARLWYSHWRRGKPAASVSLCA